ncbi:MULTISPECIES: erythromycin esterase family protein [Bradyrhizobium]|uniref:Erythromycin esterase homolog n=2 Tax=Bradyrhizobium TaxID=374 RepID=A0ABY0P812_9BRAD|nr:MULTISPECIES: erythromycin esterase family protein [Bradyrhizobium]SDH63948.1 Erythromycin esterase homolog [Bradyrhizobium ottawaense]SEE18297.1 Erythromycin esterase homolog [Bradyrhizobium lablabi]
MQPGLVKPGLFRDRREAGGLLAEKLAAYANRPDVLVLALPRGGVPVAYEVARGLGAPLDVFVVHKLGVPGYEELAMGAIATGGVRVLNDQLVERLGIGEQAIEAIAARERQELERRERLYRGDRPPPDVRGRTVILVDDGLATGATMHAAIEALRQQNPARIVVAVPMASPEACEEMKEKADDVICAITPEPFHAVGRWYQDFSQTADEEVGILLARQGTPQTGEVAQGPAVDRPLIKALRQIAYPLAGLARDYDPLIGRIGEARFALLGEASHGTHEFYCERAEITKRLIAEKNFSAVAVEADWPDAYRLNRYVRGASDDVDAVEALADFRRFPTWMWRNTVVVEFIEWLRAYNDALPPGAEKVGFYGLDLYSLHASMKAVLQYLEKVDPEAAERARERYSCFDHVGEDTEAYGLMTRLNLSRSCEEEVIGQLIELQRRAADTMRRDGGLADDDLFHAEQNARLVKNAEAYYRSVFLEEVSSWNLRDRHMAETLDALVEYLGRKVGSAKVAVWEHNSHLGDARATEMGQRGELNVGQLTREKYAGEAVLIGFTTHHGTVTAASDWGKSSERKRVRPAPAGSYEALFHAVRHDQFLLILNDSDLMVQQLAAPRLERAIGVIYRPETERQSHYFGARLVEQFDAVLNFDKTRAVKPLESTEEWETGEIPETFPFAV